VLAADTLAAYPACMAHPPPEPTGRSRRHESPQPSVSESRSGPVVVFDPSPLLGVIIEGHYDVGGADVHLHAGGQGFWAARMVAALGVPVTLCSGVGGETGAALRGLIATTDVEFASVSVKDPTPVLISRRVANLELEMIAEAMSGRFSRHEIDDLYGVTISEGLCAGVVLLTGPRPEEVIPPETYGRLTADLRSNGAMVVADIEGIPLREALAQRLDAVKLSHKQLIRDGFATGEGRDELIAGMARVVEAGADNVLVSRAAEPALALVGGENVLEITAPRLEALQGRGGGDSMSAALVAALAAGVNVETALPLAMGAGALNATRLGLGSGTHKEIRRLAELVKVTPL
jgi:1-phosphofructokinase